MHGKLKFRFMHGHTHHIGKKCRHQHDTYRRSNYPYDHCFCAGSDGYLVRYNVGIRLAIHLYEWPHDSFGLFSLPEFLKIIIKFVYPDKFIHCCQMCILVCIAYGMIHCTLEYAPYFLYGIQIWMSDGTPQDNNVALCKESYCLLGCVPRCLARYQDHLAYLPVRLVHVLERRWC